MLRYIFLHVESMKINILSPCFSSIVLRVLESYFPQSNHFDNWLDRLEWRATSQDNIETLPVSKKEPNHARNNKSGKRRKSRRVLM